MTKPLFLLVSLLGAAHALAAEPTARPGARVDPDVRVERRLYTDTRGVVLGVEVLELTPELRAHFGAPDDAGLLVSKVLAGSAAEAAGLEVGDVITTVGGVDVARFSELRGAVVDHAGTDTALGVLRGGKARTLTATLPAAESTPLVLTPEGRDLRDFHGFREMPRIDDRLDWYFDGLRERMDDDADLRSDDVERLEQRMDDMDAKIDAFTASPS